MSVDLTNFPQCVFFVVVMYQHLSVPTHGSVNGWSLLGLAEEWIVWVTTPQLLTWVKWAILWGTERLLMIDVPWTVVNKRVGMRLNTVQRKQKSREEECHNNSSHHNNITNNKTLDLSGATALYTLLHRETHSHSCKLNQWMITRDTTLIVWQIMV